MWAIPTTAITRSWSCPPRHGKWWMPWTDCVCQRDRTPIGRWRTWADMNFSPHILMGTICTSLTHWQRSSVHSVMWMPWLSRVWCRWSLTSCIRTTAVIWRSGGYWIWHTAWIAAMWCRGSRTMPRWDSSMWRTIFSRIWQPCRTAYWKCWTIPVRR